MSSRDDEAMLHRPSVIWSLLEKHGLSPKKGWGQNFLADGNTIRRIVKVADIHPGDVVVEIGPGLGGLTQALIEEGAHVIGIEKDRGLVKFLKTFFSDEQRLNVIEADALKVDLPSVLPEGAATCKVVANLPYYITSPLIMHLLESPLPLTLCVLMMQKEVADRLVAAPGTKQYGVLTVATAYWAETFLAGTVPPNVFIPAPKVSSEIVLLRKRRRPIDVGDRSTFFRLVKAAFGQRRKTIRNALRSVPLRRDEIDRLLSSAGIDGRRRGETLTIGEFATISSKLSDE